MLTGTLRLRNGVFHAAGDEQVFNGATYTNWGFGVPLLQLPFHYLSARTGWLPWPFFPDRAIYFVYLAAVIPVVWLSCDRLIAGTGARCTRGMRGVMSWSAALLVLACTVYPLMSYRFLMYEETICYLILSELLALCAYVFAAPSWGWRPVVLMGVAGGMGLLIRPTGLVLMGVWAALVTLESRRLRVVALFSAAAAPFVAFWLYSNTVRSGSPLAFGFANSLPYYPYHFAIFRFGSRCIDTPVHALQAAASLFRELFLWSSDDQPAWLTRCHFDYERRASDGRLYPHEACLGLFVLAPLVWMFVGQVRRRSRRLASLVPFGAIALLFVAYVHAGSGFAWRYVGDFWPLILIAAVRYLRELPAGASRIFGPRLAALLAVCGVVTFVRHVWTTRSTVQMLGPNDTRELALAFAESRWWVDPPLAPRAECGRVPYEPYKNGAGWDSTCGVDTSTNVYLGVPAKFGSAYVLRFEAPGMTPPTLRVYVNGRIYAARKEEGDTYVAEIEIDRAAFVSQIVMVTVEWTRGLEPPTGKLLSIELG